MLRYSYQNLIIRVSEYCLNFFWEVSSFTLCVDCFYSFTVLRTSNRGHSKRRNVYLNADSWITLCVDCFYSFTVLRTSNRGHSKRRNVYLNADDIQNVIQISFPLPNRHNVSTVATEALGNVPTSLQATLFSLSSRKLYLQSEDLPCSVQQFKLATVWA